MAEKIRQPAVAGQFYSENKEELEKEINEFMKNSDKINIGSNQKNIVGCVVPHAGYIFSGKCAGNVFNAVRELSNLSKSRQPEIFVLFGVNHLGKGDDISITMQDFETPFGILKNNNAISREIVEESNGLIKINEQAHADEHSLEVQMPFLYKINPNAVVIPILLKKSDLETCKKLAKHIYGILKPIIEKNKVLFIASSDMTHYGQNYGFLPFVEEDLDNKTLRKKLYELDKDIIKDILNLNTEEFLKKSNKTTICGSSAIAVIMEIMKLINIKKSKLVDYYGSGDISGRFDVNVGYAGIIFEK